MNVVFWITLWTSIKEALVNLKNLCVKYWQAVVGFVLVMVGYFLGREFNNKDVELADAEAKLEALRKQKENEAILLKDHITKREELLENKHNDLAEVEKQKDRNIDELSNNDEKLDNILKDKHDLKKGD